MDTSWFITHSSESESQITTDGQSASLCWNKAPIWGLQPYFYYCQTVSGLSMWHALPDERTGLSFTTAAGPRQRSHFRVPVLWDPRQYFTVSDLRLPFSSPPTTRRVTVEVFDPATRGPTVCQSRSHIATDGRSVSQWWSSWPDIITVWQLRSCFCGAPSLTRGRVCLLYMLLALASNFLPFIGTEIFLAAFTRTHHSYPHCAKGNNPQPRALFYISSIRTKIRFVLQLSV
jgi:hypothetical protein